MKQVKILNWLNDGAIFICICIAVLLTASDVYNASYFNFVFFGLAGLFALNKLLISSQHNKQATIVFFVLTNLSFLIFDGGLTSPFHTYVFFIPFMISNLIVIGNRRPVIRNLAFMASFLTFFFTSFTDVTPRLINQIIAPEHAELLTYFNITVAFSLTIIIFEIIVQGSFRVEEMLLNEQDQLNINQQLLNSINQNIDIGICRTDIKKDKLVYVNRAMVNMFGYDSESEMLHVKPARLYKHNKERKKLLEAIEQTGSVQYIELEYVRKDGSSFWGSITSNKLIDENGHVMYDGALRDITEIRKMREALTEAKNLAEQASLAKSKFLSAMSHEIRTPLNAVIGITELLLAKEREDADDKENLEVLKSSGQNLLRLLNNLIDFNKIEAGKIDLHVTPNQLRSLIDDVVNIYQFQARNKGITIETVYPDFHEYVLIDHVRFSQVLVNLVSNAVKFTEKGSIRVGYEILSKSRNKVTIRTFVTDTGIGIDRDKIETIFNAFSQENYDITSKYGGSGLGLAISRRILDMMHSRIDVVSEKHKGSTFSFITDLDIATHFYHQALDLNKKVLPEMKGLHVLLVEDNMVNVMVASKMLKNWAFDVTVAQNGSEAISKMKQPSGFDLVLMDLHMPEMDGFEATRHIRKTDPHTPIIALTADALAETGTKCREAGMNDYVVKPFNPKELYQKIYSVVQHN